MMYSNQPYQRVDDGIGSGLVGGAVVGAAALGGFHAAGRQMAKTVASNPLTGVRGKGLASSIAEQHGKFKHMSGKRKALAYGGSVLAGSLLGGVTDALNN